MTPENIDHEEALERKFAARPEWAVAMCAHCYEWIRPNLTCACPSWKWRSLTLLAAIFLPLSAFYAYHRPGVLEWLVALGAIFMLVACIHELRETFPWDLVLLLYGGTAVTLALIAALGYFLDERHVLGWWMVLAATFALISSIYAIQKTNGLARHQWDFVLLLVGGIAVTFALIAALGYYLAEKDGRTSRRLQRRGLAVVPRAGGFRRRHQLKFEE